ncbi:hypothetical protein GVAV_000457 [Gurleya vavrai]
MTTQEQNIEVDANTKKESIENINLDEILHEGFKKNDKMPFYDNNRSTSQSSSDDKSGEIQQIKDSQETGRWTTFESMKRNCVRKESVALENLHRAKALISEQEKNNFKNKCLKQHPEEFKKFSNDLEIKQSIDEDLRRIKMSRQNEFQKYNRMLLENAKQAVNFREEEKKIEKMKIDLHQKFRSVANDPKICFNQDLDKEYRLKFNPNKNLNQRQLYYPKSTSDYEKQKKVILQRNNTLNPDQSNQIVDKNINDKIEAQRKNFFKNTNLRMNHFLQQNIQKNENNNQENKIKEEIKKHSVSNDFRCNNAENLNKRHFSTLAIDQQENYRKLILKNGQRAFFNCKQSEESEKSRIENNLMIRNDKFETIKIANQSKDLIFKGYKKIDDCDKMIDSKRKISIPEMYIDEKRIIEMEKQRMYEAALGLLKLSKDFYNKRN